MTSTTSPRTTPALSPPGVPRADDADRRRVRRLALIFMGLAHLTVLRQRYKGAAYALVELAFLAALPSLIGSIVGIITLGSPRSGVPVTERDNSMFMLVDGVIAFAIVAVFVAIYAISVRGALNDFESGVPKESISARKQFTTVSSKAFPVVGLAPTILLILFFVFIPLVFSALVAFTNYSSPLHIPPGNTVDWVGFENFVAMFGGNQLYTGALLRVFTWTVIWAFLAVGTSYFAGMILAVILHESKIRIKPFFQAIFILPYAVPAIVSLLIWRSMLNGAFGTVNTALMDLGLIDEAIPWLTDPTLARFTVVLINLWSSFPYFMLLTMSAMTAISPDVKEAAALDGATGMQRFRHITFPLVTYQTAPLLIMSFAANFNNFGAIYFLTNGGPNLPDTTQTGAGATDILVSWLFQITIELQQYHYGSVIAVVIFLVLAPFAILQFRRTKAFRGDN